MKYKLTRKNDFVEWAHFILTVESVHTNSARVEIYDGVNIDYTDVDLRALPKDVKDQDILKVLDDRIVFSTFVKNKRKNKINDLMEELFR